MFDGDFVLLIDGRVDEEFELFMLFVDELLILLLFILEV